MAASSVRTGVVLLTLALAAAPASAEPPDMVAGGLVLMGDQGVNWQLEARYAPPLRPYLWWSNTAGVGAADVFHPGGGGGDDGWMAEARSGLLLRACNHSLCGGLGAALGAQHRRVSYAGDVFGPPEFHTPAYQNRQTSLLGDARLHAQFNFTDDARAGVELTFGLRLQYIVAQGNTPMTQFEHERSPVLAGVVLGAGLVGSL